MSLSDKTVAQLKELADELSISFKSKIRKGELIAAIEAHLGEPTPTIESHKMVCSNLEFASPEKESEVEPTAAPDPQIGAKRLSNFIWAKHKAKAKAKRKQQQKSRRRNRR